MLGRPVGLVGRRLNRFLVGWSNYFGCGDSRRAFGNINAYVQLRLWDRRMRDGPNSRRLNPHVRWDDGRGDRSCTVCGS